MDFDNIEDIQKLAYDELCGFINADMSDDDVFDDFIMRVNTIMNLLRMNGVTVISEWSPYYQFLGIANDGTYAYSQRQLQKTKEIQMKSTIGYISRDHGQYTTAHFKAISENGFRYYHSATEGVLLYFNGKWVQYNTVRQSIPSLPEVFNED